MAHKKYLGLPTYIGKSKKRAFMLLNDRLVKRLSNWIDRFLSRVGREVLMKVVAQAISTYAMSVSKIPQEFRMSIQSIINRF